MDNQDVCGVILCGGKSSRMGRDKSSLPLGRQPMLEVIAEKLMGTFPRVIAIGNYKPSQSLQSKISVFPDIVPGLGPLGGIFTALKVSGSAYNFVVACDMPFINIQLARYMKKEMEANGYDLVIPATGGLLEPLHAFYHKNSLGVAEEMIQEGNLRIGDLARRVNTRYIAEDELRSWDPKLACFFNVNTPKEYETVKNTIV